MAELFLFDLFGHALLRIRHSLNSHSRMHGARTWEVNWITDQTPVKEESDKAHCGAKSSTGVVIPDSSQRVFAVELSGFLRPPNGAVFCLYLDPPFGVALLE